MSADAPWVMQQLPASFIETHSQRRSEYRLSETKVAAYLAQAGQEAAWLLQQVAQHARAK